MEEAISKKLHSQTIYHLRYGSDKQETEVRYFRAEDYNDAITTFSQKVTEYTSDENVEQAWVQFSRLPDITYPKGQYVCSWNKSSLIKELFTGFLEIPSF